MTSPKRVGVTTTNSIEGWEIQHYFQPVTSHLVVGTNVFSDFLASFTDFFGGASKTYQRKISELYTEAIEQLRISTERVGANFIIGLSIDLDEISGKGKSMFMITAIGTPVLASKASKTENKPDQDVQEVISSDKMEVVRQKRNILQGIAKNSISLEKETWQFVIENKLVEAFPYLINKWKKNIEYQLETSGDREKVTQLLAQLDPMVAAKLVYDLITDEDSTPLINGLTYAIKDLRLVDFDLIEEALKSDDFDRQRKILFAVIYDKEYYTKTDVERLKEIREIIQSTFRERGERSSKKQMFSSKEKEIWKCGCGKSAEMGEYCPGCGNDIYGFKKNEIKPNEAISHIDEKIAVIDELIGNN